MRNLPLVSLLGVSLQAGVVVEKTAYDGWPNCYRVSNGEVELIVTTDVGPRVIRYGFVGGQNMFKEFEEQLGKHGEPDWLARGGHRLWMGPEDRVLSYAPDNEPIQIEVQGDAVTLTEKVEKLTGLRKEIVVKLATAGSGVEVTHRITNAGAKSRRLAPWALTVMAQGGMEIVALPPRGTHPKDLPPTNPLVMWAYTDLSDDRWKFTQKYLLLRQDRSKPAPQKIGTFNRETVGAYLLGSDLFIKRATASDPLRQPDWGCSYETFTNDQFLEIETLGELTDLRPGATATHVERWSLHRNVRIPEWTDAAIDAALAPLR